MKILITGGHGKLGRYLAPQLDAIVPAHAEMDVRTPEMVNRFVSRPEIDAVVHLAALCDRKQVESDRDLAWDVNVNGTRNVAEACANSGKKLVYLSTERVFDGTTGDYHESDPTNPPDWYGNTKAAGEREVLKASANNLVIRTSFRPTPWPFPTAFTDVITTADYIDIIAEDIALCLGMNQTGILHIGTPKKTLLELARKTRPGVAGEPCPDPSMGRRLDLNIARWLELKKNHG